MLLEKLLPLRARLAVVVSLVAVLTSGESVAAPSGANDADRVTIYRDARGVPHVFGKSSAQVMYGAGYALASDRLAQMELVRRRAAGRRAEILGKEAIESDKTSRDRQLPDQELMRMYHEIPREHQLMISAFVEGINRVIQEIESDPENRMPLEFARWGIKPEVWSLIDYLASVASVPYGRGGWEIQNLEFLQSMTARYGLEAGRQVFDDIVPLSDPGSPTTIAPEEDLAPSRPDPVPTYLTLDSVEDSTGAGVGAQSRLTGPAKGASRCLVVGPEKSASGNVLMLEATADGPEIHLHGGGFDTAGFVGPGFASPIMGRGVQHGWLLTSGVAQANSVFAEHLNPENKYQYWFNGEWKAMERRTEVIRVKDAEPLQYEVVRTVHGPVVAWDDEQKVAYSHQFANRGTELETWVGIVEMGRASSLKDFEEKGVNRLGWNLDVCYGGEDGQIAFWEAGALPKLAEGVDPRLPAPGTGEYEWQGFLTPEEQPRVVNPSQGFIHNWNSKSTSWMPEGNEARIGAAFRTWLGDELVSSSDAITLLDMRDFNGMIFNAMGAQDRTQTTPAFFEPYIRAAIDESDDPRVRQAGELMLSYNGRYEDFDRDHKYDNPGLTLFRHWLKIAPEMIFQDDVGEWWRKIDGERYLRYQTSLLLRALKSEKAGAPLTRDYFNGRDRTEMIIETIVATVEQLESEYPAQPMTDWRMPVYWKYYDPSLETPQRPSLGEDDETRLSAVLRLGPTMAPHNGGEGWVGLMEIDPDNPALYSVIDAGGQNQFISLKGEGNPNLTDQTMMHETNELKKIVMKPEAVRATAVSVEYLDYAPED